MKVPKKESNMCGKGIRTGRRIESDLARFVCRLAYRLPDDVISRLREMADREKDPAAGKVYRCMLENVELADRLSRPLCQDTGIPCFYIKTGAEGPFAGNLSDIVCGASAKAFRDAPMRPNAVDPFTGKNTGDNQGPCCPYIDWEVVPGDGLEITVYLAGGGCSLPGFAAVLTPGEGLEKAVEMVTEKVLEKGVNACPPLLIGVGIGATADIAAKLSKKALLRPLGSKNQSSAEAARLEKDLFDRLNSLGIGPGGMGGSESVLGVNVEAGVRHPATFAVALSTGCWATRRGVIRFDKDGGVSSPDHRDFI